MAAMKREPHPGVRENQHVFWWVGLDINWPGTGISRNNTCYIDEIMGNELSTIFISTMLHYYLLLLLLSWHGRSICGKKGSRSISESCITPTAVVVQIVIPLPKTRQICAMIFKLPSTLTSSSSSAEKREGIRPHGHLISCARTWISREDDCNGKIVVVVPE